MGQPVLWHLPASHYGEKVRWALDHKRIEQERHAPITGYHTAVALYLIGGRHYAPCGRALRPPHR